MSNSLQPHGLQDTRIPCLSLSPRVCSISCPLNQWCYPVISSSVTPFSSCPPSFPASGSFPRSWLFASGGQSIGASASASVLPMNTQCWFPLELTVLISLLLKGLESSPAQFQNINSLMLSLMVQHPYMTTKKVTVLTIWMSAKWCLCFFFFKFEKNFFIIIFFTLQYCIGF